DMVARRVGGSSQLAGLAASVVRRLYRFDCVETMEIEHRLGASALDILATTLESELRPSGAAAAGQERLAEIKRRMLERLPDPAFDLALFAAEEGVAARTLYRLFAREGTTPMRWLWRQRLAAAHRLLAEHRVETVTEAAMSAGFSEASHFSRAFKAAYGRSPRDLLYQ